MARFILNKSILKEQYNFLKEHADVISYSFKTNPIVGSILEYETNCWISVHTIKTAEKIRQKDRILFFAQGWKQEDVRNLFSLGIQRFVIDNKNDLQVFLDTLPLSQKPITIFLRLKLKEYSVQTGKHFVFGMSIEEINALAPSLKKIKWIEAIGIHFHRRTQNIHEWSVKRELKESLTNDTLNAISFMDIGGGFPVRYKNSSLLSLHHIFKEIKDLRSWLTKKNISLVIEPGRFLAAPCIILEAKIINIYDNTIIVDCSVYNAAMDTFIANVRLEIEGEKESREPYVVKGCTPDSVDIFRYRVFLDKPEIGNTIRFLNAGAYTFTSDFCDLQPIETVIV